MLARSPGLRAGTNVSRLSDPSLERLMGKAQTTTGEADRAERWADVDRRVTELAPGVPIVWNREPNLRSEDVKGVLDVDLAAWALSFTSLRAP
jgi:ABC-type transport system substrate-binding protein